MVHVSRGRYIGSAEPKLTTFLLVGPSAQFPATRQRMPSQLSEKGLSAGHLLKPGLSGALTNTSIGHRGRLWQSHGHCNWCLMGTGFSDPQKCSSDNCSNAGPPI